MIPDRHWSRLVLLNLLFLLCSGLFLSCGPETTAPTSEGSATLNLRQVDFRQGAVEKLDTGWAFYPRRTAEEVLALADSLPFVVTAVPGIWNGIKEGNHHFGAFGYGTYRLRIILPDTLPPMGLEFSTIGTSYRLYANDQLIRRVGVAGRNAEESQADYLPGLVALPLTGPTVTLTLMVSNFSHRSGGLWESIHIGSLVSLQKEREQKLANSLFLLGAIFIIGLYHLGVYSLQSRGRTALYFGLVCLTLALRESITGVMYVKTLWPGFNWQILTKLEYLSFYIGIPLFFMVLQALFPRDYHPRSRLLIQGVGVFFSLLVLAFPPSVFSRTLTLYQVFGFLVASYAILGLVRAFIRAEQGAGIVLAGFLAVLITFVNDILYSQQIVPTGYLISLGVLIFIFSQAFLLSQRAARAVATIEQQRLELANTNEAYIKEIDMRKAVEAEVRQHRNHLEDLVRERTNELEELNAQLRQLSLVDGLTKIANRRRLDEEVAREWLRMRRQKGPLAFIIADIDHFKAYNDTYGHQEGDKCLQKVAAAIAGCVKRPGDLAARYGGEEFGLLLPDTDLDGAERLAQGVHDAVARLRLPNINSQVDDYVSLSLGVAAGIPGKEQTASQLIEQADRALYEAKGEGRDRVVVKSYPE